MNHWEAALLGLVQGLTEFLPVSSSGHLVLAHHALGMSHPSIFNEVMLHAGTLVAIFIAFWRDLWGVISGGTRGALGCLRGGVRETWLAEPGFRLLVFMVLGTVPVAVAGLLVKDHLEALGGSPAIVGLILVANGLMLLYSRRLFGGEVTLKTMVLRIALFVGVLQVCALLPGISRSGTTITAALVAGVGRDAAGRFSFLLAVPAICGATLLELVRVLKDGGPSEPWGPILLGTCVAAVVGYVSILGLMKLVRSGRFYVFGPYCIVLGLVAAAVAYF